MTGDILAAIIGLETPEVVALKLGTVFVNELLRHPQRDDAGSTDLLSSAPGRIRMRVAAIKRAPELARKAEARLAKQAGITSATANPVTGTVLVSFDESAVDRPKVERLISQAVAAHRVIPADLTYRIPTSISDAH